MYKKIIIFFIIILIIGTSVFAIWKGINKPSSQENLKSKINEELDYIQRSIINLANELNNISIQDYKVSTKTTTNPENKGQQNSTSESKSGSSTKSESGSSSGDSSQQGGASQDSSSSSSNTILLYKMVPTTQENQEIDWSQIEADLNNLYSTWSQVMLDLYKANTNNDDILAFGRNLDEATKYIKSKDKVNSLSLIAKLCNYIPKFINSYAPEETRKIYMQMTKTNILNAYALIEQEKWDEIKNQISQAENNYNKVLNDINNNKNQYNINKVYILLKEFQNSIDIKDKDVLYLRYKNLIQEIINI